MVDGFRLQLLGGFRLAAGNGVSIPIPQRKGTALIAYLGATIGSLSSRDTLASLLWGQSPQNLARQSLRQALQALGQSLAGDSARILCLDRQMVGLNAEHVQVDVAEFEALVARGNAESLAQASRLYQGEFLAGLSVNAPDFEDWLAHSRGKFRDLALHMLVNLIEQRDAAGDYELATESANQAVRIDPFREDVHRHLMRMYAARGMRAEALSQYRTCAAILRRELDVTPDEETERLYDSILAQGAVSRLILAGSQRPGPVTAGATRAAASPLIGFDRELNFLRRCIADAAEIGARMVLVTGEAGAGKSALLAEIRHGRDRQGAVMATARARPAERRMNFAFWADLLNSPPLDVAGDRDSSSSLVRRLAFLRGGRVNWNRQGQAAEGDDRHVFDAAVELIRARARDTTLILAIEDLQHADDASLRLLSYVLRNVGRSSVVVLATLRSEALAGRRDLQELLNDLDRDGLLSRLPLQPLSRVQVERLLQALRQSRDMATVPRSRLREIWTLSDGNPGLVVEMARGGAGDSTANLPPDVPESLYADLARRIGGLDEGGKLIAAAASVIGKGIEHDLLARATGLDEATTLRGVEALVAAGLLVLNGNDLAFARRRLQVVQYRSLMPARRRHLHLAVAAAIAERGFDGSLAHDAALVHHYKAAGCVAEALSSDVRLAQTHWRRGSIALARRTFRRVLQTARERADDTAVRRCESEARLGLAAIEEAAGQFGAALALLRGVPTDGAARPTARLTAQLLYARSRLNGVLGNDELAHDYVRRAAEAAQGEDGNLWPPLDRILELIHFAGGNAGPGTELVVDARRRADRHGFVTDNIYLSAMLGLLRAASGEGDLALVETGAAIDAASELGDGRLLALGMQIRGIARTWCGDPSGALADFDAAFEMANLCGDLPRLYQIHGHKGHALIRAGQFPEAVGALDIALAMAGMMDIRCARPLFQAWKAETLVNLGDPAAGRAEARAALQWAAAANRPWAHSVALRALASAMAHPGIGDFVGAERAIRIALEEQNAICLAFERASSLVTYARILQMTGKTRRSKSRASQAQVLFKQMKTALNREAVRGLAAKSKSQTGSKRAMKCSERSKIQLAGGG